MGNFPFCLGKRETHGASWTVGSSGGECGGRNHGFMVCARSSQVRLHAPAVGP